MIEEIAGDVKKDGPHQEGRARLWRPGRPRRGGVAPAGGGERKVKVKESYKLVGMWRREAECSETPVAPRQIFGALGGGPDALYQAGYNFIKSRRIQALFRPAHQESFPPIGRFEVADL